ncbi:MAG: outer membrane lipoprotein carrier protein LolA [Kofleriaceae bacterium]
MKAILMVMLVAGVAHADEATTVLAKAQQFYANASHLQAKFEQQVTNTTFGKTDTSQGNVYIAKPGSFRFDYNNKSRAITKTFAFDGKTGWFVDNVNKKIHTGRATGAELPAAVSFLTGGDLAKQFTVALDATGAYAAKEATVLKLTPKVVSAQYKPVYFVVDPKDGHVRESVVINSNGDVNHFKFYAPDLKTPVEPALFQINTHQPGYTVGP